MIKKYFIAMATTTFIIIGGTGSVFASASMPTDQSNVEKIEQEEAGTDYYEIQPWWQQWFNFDRDVQQQSEEVSNNTETVDAEQLHAFEQEVLTLTNKEREKNGLAPFKLDTELSKVAREKSADMANKGYFDHQSPTYGSPFDMMEQFGITYRTAGENIAMGQRTPDEVVTAWMNSEGHRANILNSNFTHIGIGYVENGHYWTQQFIGK